MAIGRLEAVAYTFQSASEALHEKFLTMTSDAACVGCRHAGFGEAILIAWLQMRWTDFTRSLVIASAQGTRRTRGTSVSAVPGVKSRADAERIVKTAVTSTVKKHGTTWPVWHAPWFVIQVGNLVALNNLSQLQSALGPTQTPGHMSAFRNYLVHPGTKSRHKYEQLQAKLGMLRMEPEYLLHQHQRPGLTVFTSWVRDLQRIANDATR